MRVRALALLALLAAPLAAQGPRGVELGVTGVAAGADPAWAGGGLSLGLRPGGRVRLVLAALAGDAAGLTGRGELTGQYLLWPGRLTGVGAYAFGGVAGQAGARDAGYVVLGLGLEGRPGAASGWHLEAGIGGGARVAVGWRWRRLRPAGRG